MIEPINQEATQFFEDHALFDDEEVQILSASSGARIAETLGPHRAIILANHGLLTTGTSAADAVGWLITMERVCEVHLKAQNPVRLSGEAARLSRDDIVSGSTGWQAFEYLVRHHL